ncbi:hypothetical protein [Sphingobacterium lactis]|uniref:Uncharacterized protein n=1 Tax=Sphingobacterium lactis TaxID=797291 RepID=A0A1H5S7T5_9SPHI|nr:hypothetical protein [Sphingobacterium lactis]SEF46484.1 hypothetical protein SAMN05421877_101185 [Sphingobacterium lactis]
MANKRFNATYEKIDARIKVQSDVFTWTEDGMHFYFAPALDLVGYGENDIEAQNSFELVLKEFIEYTHNKKTLFDELERLGWTINKKKKRALPPTTEQLIDDNEDFKRLLQRNDIKSHSRSIQFA